MAGDMGHGTWRLLEGCRLGWAVIELANQVARSDRALTYGHLKVVYNDM